MGSKALDNAMIVQEMLAQLERKPLHMPTFPELSVFDPDTPEYKCVQIASEGFCYPLKGMRERLTNVIHRAEQEFHPSSPLGKQLKKCAEAWLKALDSLDPSNDKATIKLHLAPSMLLGKEGIIEEKVQNGRRYIHLPIAVVNHGPGPAVGVVVRIDWKAGQAITLDGSKEQSLGPMQRGETHYPVFRFWQDRDEPIAVKVIATFWDWTGEEVKEEYELFQWPALQHYADGSISNPFVIGRPVATEAEFQTVFVGHTRQLNKLLELVRKKSGTLIFVRGLRRVGKTSLILQFQRKISEENFLVVYVDCDLLQKQAALTPTTWGEIDFLREVAIITAVAAATNRIPTNGIPQDFSSNPTQARKQFRDLLLKINGQKRIILVFDETDDLGTGSFADFAPAFLALLTELANDGISSIFVHELTDGFWSDPERLPAYFPVRVGLLNRNQTRLLATSKLVEPETIANLSQSILNQMPNLIFTPLAFECLWLITGGYPFLVQLICYYLVENKISFPTGGRFNLVVEVEDVKHIVQKLIYEEDERAQLEYLSLGFGKDEKQFLLQIGQIDNRGYREIEPRDGMLRFLRLRRDGLGRELRDKHKDESEEDYAQFLDIYSKNWIWQAFRRLRHKRIVIGYDDVEDEQDELEFPDNQVNEYEGQSSKQMNSILRLRVGFFWLYLRDL